MINISKFIKSLGFAFQGFGALLKSENNARIHALATVLVIPTCIFLKIDKYEWLWICLAIALVWAFEALNTAIEALVDLASPEFHPMAKKAKDVAAFAVLAISMFAIVVAGIVLGGKL